MMTIMTTAPDNRTKLLAEVERRAKHFDSVKALADVALSQAADDRAQAIREAMRVATAKDVAEAVGVSRARLYQIVKDL